MGWHACLAHDTVTFQKEHAIRPKHGRPLSLSSQKDIIVIPTECATSRQPVVEEDYYLFYPCLSRIRKRGYAGVILEFRTMHDACATQYYRYLNNIIGLDRSRDFNLF
jgi:hypothetical protein